MTAVGVLNVGLAIIGALIAFGAANRMNRGTECTIVFAFATVAAGLVGWAITSMLPESAQQAFDTLLLGGIVALIIGTRKQTIWLAPAWMPYISIGVSGLTWIAFFCTVT